MYDVIIIGAGPAGISASLYTIRSNLKTLLIYKEKSALEKATKIENYYGFENGINGEELYKKGIEQAKKLADIVKKHNIDIILSSPLKRAIETSQIVADKNDITLQVVELLIEQNYGIYEGVDRKNDNFLANKRNFAYKYPNGESMMQVAYRIYGLIDKIKEQYQGKNILIISHGGICRIIRTYFIDMSNDEFFNYTLENGKLEEYEL